MKSKVFILVICFFSIFSCSTKKNTFVSRNYHDLTSYFNVLFNGRESFQIAEKRVEKTQPESFDDILPVFAFDFPNVAGEVSGEMQRAIDKGNKTIVKHSITVKPKKKKNLSKEQKEFYNKNEFVRWIDDAHLLIAQSLIYLNEQDLAYDKLDYINAEYPKEEQTIAQSRIYQALIDTRRGEYNKAENTLRSLHRSKKFPENQRPFLNAAYADFYIKQKRYSEAIPFLEKALSRTHNRAKKTRYNYILAQLYEKTSNNAKAHEHFKKVTKMNPPYLMAFNAEMSMLSSYGGDKNNVKNVLEKALTDERNENYQDRIYYALAQIEESAGNIEKAMSYYRQSINAWGSNNRQKGQAYQALAKHYIQKPDYINAYIAYDSAARLYGPTHSYYKEMFGEAQKLRKLALNLKVLENEDSLRKLASLSDSERQKIIEREQRLREDGYKKAEEEKLAQEKRMQQLEQDNEGGAQGDWYFYNSAAVSLGQSDFESRWGKRKLEDNWRRKDRNIEYDFAYQDDNEYENPLETAQTKVTDTIASEEDLLKNIPIGQEAMKASDERITQAMFYIGEAYRDDLKNVQKAIESFEELESRFNNYSYQSATYVALFELYKTLGEAEKAEHYRTLMLSKYPKDPRVLASNDPTYMDRMLKKEQEEVTNYMAAVRLFSSGQHTAANNAAQQALASDPQGRLAPQYSLLQAMSGDYKGNVALYKEALRQVMEKFPNTEAANTAKSLLAGLGEDELVLMSLNREPENKAAEVISVEFDKNDGTHFFAIIFDNNEDINKLKFSIASFNADNFLNANYEIQMMDFGSKKDLLIVGEMKDKKAAMNYYNKVTTDKNIFKSLENKNYIFFVISDANMFKISESKSAVDYYEFFKTNYLK